METSKIVQIDCSTGEEIVRDMTEEEISLLNEISEYNEQQRIAQEAEEAAKLAAKESAVSKLSSLGLTEEEIQALVG